jgi:Leucine-rich repeat (LRR) protein
MDWLMRQIALLPAFLAVFFLSSPRVSAQASTQDSLVLVDLYNNTNGPGWTNHTNWLTTAPLSTWFGVYIFDNVHVGILNLPSNNLVGTLPSSLGNLTATGISMDLSNNRISGSLPSSLTNLPGSFIINLRFSHNQLSGAIPNFPAFFTCLLDISYNDFSFADLEPYVTSGHGGLTDSTQADLPLIQNGSTLSIAAGGTLSNNTYTWYKDGTVVATNTGDATFTMTGTGVYAVSVTNTVVPSLTLYSIENLNPQDSLALIDLFNNAGGSTWTKNSNWATSAPASSWNGIVTRSGRVQQVYLPSNNLSGPLPSSLSNLTAATQLNLYNNELTGYIPSSFGNLQALQVMELASNQLNGNIPSGLGTLTNLKLLDLSSNQLTGAIPTTLGNLANLSGLLVASNQLTGQIPAELGNLTNLINLSLSDNQLTDTIPASLGNLGVLEQFGLQANQLTGQIPPAFGRLKSLIGLDLDSNQITGSIPDSICRMTQLAHLLLYNNKLTGQIPDSLGNDAQLIDIQLQNNNLSGSTKADLSQLYIGLLNISGNQFNFSILPMSLQSYTTFTYSPQQNISLSRTEDKLSVSAGGNSAHSTYTLFKDGVSLATQAGDSLFTIGGLGNYNIVTTNTYAPQLTLYSDTLKLGLVLPDSTTTTTQPISGSTPVDINTNIFRITTLTPGTDAYALAGSVTALETVDDSILTFQNAPYVQRHYDITPSLDPTTATATVSLYYTQSDFDAYNTYVTSHSLNLPLLPSGGADNGNIIIAQYHGSFTGTSSPDNYNQGSQVIKPIAAWDATDNWWTVTFPVSGFSGFFLSTGNIPLPLTLLQFTGAPQGYQVNLQWQTTAEQNTKQFIIQRSPDGNSFDPIGTVAAKNTSGQNQYGFNDTHPSTGNNFYRLKMQDQDGRFTYSPIVQVVIGDLPASCLAYPNPATNSTSLLFNASTAASYSIEITDQSGNVLTRLTGTSAVGLNKIDIDVHSYAPGTYILTLTGTERGRQSIHLLKE